VSESTTAMSGVMIDLVTGEIIDQKELAERLLAQAKERGVSLVGPGGLLNQLTRNVLESALEAELTEHLGHEHGQAPIAANMRNGTRSKNGADRDRVARDRDGSFEPVIVPKRKRCLDGIDEVVLSLSARGLTTGESAAHFEEVYGARVSKDTLSRITEMAAAELAERSARRLDPIYRVLFVDALWSRSVTGRCATPRSTSSWESAQAGSGRFWASGPATVERVPGSGCRYSLR
jgi:putative transposase